MRTAPLGLAIPSILLAACGGSVVGTGGSGGGGGSTSSSSSSGTVSSTPDGAFFLAVEQGGTAQCPIADHTAAVGEIDAATRTNVIPDAVGGTTVSCEVLGSFQAHGKIDDLANTGNYLEIDIPSITPAASESAPAQGAISFSGPWTAGNAFSGNCDFYFTPGTPETVDTGKIWVTFTCPGLQSGLSTCPLQIGYAIFENCLTE